ncbi:hypothetical protein N9H39_03950 [Gammaproteobacteria bacterium]|nr:hypothetical protein [Gammaproteobacteria bacterium]
MLNTSLETVTALMFVNYDDQVSELGNSTLHHSHDTMPETIVFRNQGIVIDKIENEWDTINPAHRGRDQRSFAIICNDYIGLDLPEVQNAHQ